MQYARDCQANKARTSVMLHTYAVGVSKPGWTILHSLHNKLTSNTCTASMGAPRGTDEGQVEIEGYLPKVAQSFPAGTIFFAVKNRDNQFWQAAIPLELWVGY